MVRIVKIRKYVVIGGMFFVMLFGVVPFAQTFTPLSSKEIAILKGRLQAIWWVHEAIVEVITAKRSSTYSQVPFLLKDHQAYKDFMLRVRPEILKGHSFPISTNLGSVDIKPEDLSDFVSAYDKEVAKQELLQTPNFW